jgi:Flp pilus assembly protein TadG
VAEGFWSLPVLQICRHTSSRKSKRLTGRELLRTSVGTSLIETLAGFAIIIPIGLLAVDLTMVVSASQLNERLAEDAARAAGNQSTEQDARAAAQTAISSYQITSPISAVTLTNVNFDPGNAQVQVISQMIVNLPVPITTLDKVTLNADAVQPIVSIPAPP